MFYQKTHTVTCRCQVHKLSLTECCVFLYCHKIWKDNIKQIPNITTRTIHGIFLADKLQVSCFDPVSTIPVMLHNPNSFTYIWCCIFYLPIALVNKTNHKHHQQEQCSYILLMTLKIYSEENASPDWQIDFYGRHTQNDMWLLYPVNVKVHSPACNIVQTVLPALQLQFAPPANLIRHRLPVWC